MKRLQKAIRLLEKAGDLAEKAVRLSLKLGGKGHHATYKTLLTIEGVHLSLDTCAHRERECRKKQQISRRALAAYRKAKKK